MKDGVLLCKLINHAVPDTVDMRCVHLGHDGPLSVYQVTENLNLAINAAVAAAITPRAAAVPALALTRATPAVAAPASVGKGVGVTRSTMHVVASRATPCPFRR